ncbi:hypothetical protein C7B65_02205 [Phormidesmis priestleyi ULC007]|uniref:Uncharacterized protein n=1 Tax=Phormidesmis priestleyi ULC007 TaxID=1920490 RepID=A0A2T1DP62_9CYAN|nr:hypothetical protein [Phormidesmis priestleyi]PSB22235.1 hypothetical protein C7B65_02205 [Phormidesmis priestleyi ULC007]PZO52504.1 MAG: hypothetical protein DCF14_05980 [Phormidesmis priestleyi]
MTTIQNISTKTNKKLTTPQLIRSGLYITWGAGLLALITTITGVQEQRNAIKTVGKDTTPSIITAQRLKDGIAGMDAFAASEFLVPSRNIQSSFLEPVEKDKDGTNIQSYNERYRSVTERLIAAANNITYDEEREPIQTMQLGIGDYVAKIQQARDAHARRDQVGTLAAYLAAAEVMDKTLLPAADRLDQVNVKALNRTYEDQKFGSARSLFLIAIVILGLAGFLVMFQLFLSRRTRRTLNPFLLSATAIALLFLAHTIGSLLSASQHLTVAKRDAFESMHSLRQARALAYSANADESRYLLDVRNAATHEQAFFDKMNQIATPPNGQTFEQIILLARQESLTQQETKLTGLTGFLGDELSNITFPGERPAVIETLSALSNYLKIDQQIRQLQQNGKYREAIALCTGSNPGESDWAFNEFRKANQKTYDVNDKAFNDAITQGNQDLAGFEIKSAIAVIAIALLVLWGVMPRLKEYS